MTTTFDITHVRSQFPSLEGPQVYLDNAGGSQTLGTVIEAIKTYLTKTNVQLGGTYPVSQSSTDLYTAGCKAVSTYIHAPSPSNIVLGSSTTQLFRNLSFALFEHLSPPGSEIIISRLDHEANIACWVQIAEWKGCKVVWWDPAESGPNPGLELGVLRGLMTERTRLVACTQTSNVLGTINDIKGIAGVVHEREGALLVVDSVAYAPHREIDVGDLGVDFYSFSWYKLFAGHIASLYASPAGLKALGSLGHFFRKHDSLEDKMGLGGASYELVASIPPVCEYLEKLPWDVISRYEEKLQGIAIDYLNSKPDVFQIYGEPTADRNKRVPVISFTVKGKKPQEVVGAIEAKSNLGCRAGSFYSNRLVEHVLGLDPAQGVIRISMVHYNTGELIIHAHKQRHGTKRLAEEEVRDYIKVLDEVIRS